MTTLLALAPGLLRAQAPQVRITQPIDNTQRVRLAGNTSPWAIAANDRGAAPASLVLSRMLLVLKRSGQQELALRQLLDEQREQGGPNYRQWLTPAQFGQRFAPAPADVAQVTAWLASQGFQVTHVAAGGWVIEFSGTAGNLAAAFHTSMHQYAVAGTLHWANATDPEIPAALAPVVAGIVSLNDFRKRPANTGIIGRGVAPPASSGAPVPSLYGSTSSGPIDVVAPADFATIYNDEALWSGGTAGKGETIALVERSDINSGDLNSFELLFTPASITTFQTVLDGPDPGIVTDGDDVEATLDAEWAVAVAPAANVDLVVSDPTDTTDGVDLSALYVVDNDLAPVMSTSFGLCEADDGTVENEFWNSLWEQAAAEGISSFVSTGDSGAAGCDDPSETAATDGLAVSGLASTPFDTAVGGTEFNEGSGTYWNTNTTSNDYYGSALSYIPETVWNESAADSPGSGGVASLAAGGGGLSIIYPQPAWQAGPGVTSGAMRAIPDLSLNAAAGHDAYLLCYENSCTPQNGFAFEFYMIGGTSVASPAMAGIQALVDQQQAARQGLANPVYYQLAADESDLSSCAAGAPPADSCILHDVTTGNNAVPCVSGSPDCPASGEMGYDAGPGYDLATGLGSVNISNLISAWGNVKFAASTTTLGSLPAGTLTHGQSVPVSIQVAATGSGPTPTGSVELLAEYSDGSVASIQDFPLNNGAVSSTTALLPGGSYNVAAQYSGDLNYGSSLSGVQPVNVNPEASQTQAFVYVVDANGNETTATQVPYGSDLYIKALPAGTSGQGIPTGTVAFNFTNSSFTTIAPATATLNAAGQAVLPFPFVPPGMGVNTFTAAYSGDASFSASTSSPVSFTVVPGATTTTLTAAAIFDDAITLTATVATQANAGGMPTGEVEFFDGTTAIGETEVYSSANSTTGIYGATASYGATGLSGATATITAQYLGDAHYGASTSNAITVTTPADLVFNPGTLAFGVVNIGSSVSMSATLTNDGGTASGSLEGSLDPETGGFSNSWAVTSNCGSSGLAPAASCTFTFTFAPTVAGVSYATYQLPLYGGVYLSGSAPGILVTDSGYGTLGNVTPGQSATDTLTLSPFEGYAGPVTLACGANSFSPPLSTCSFSPATVTLDGTDPVEVTLTVTTTAPSSGSSWFWLGVTGSGLLLLWMGVAWKPGRRWRLAPVGLVLAIVGGMACGGGGGGGGGIGSVGGNSDNAPPVALLSPSSLNFGVVSIGTSAQQTVTLTNTGGGALDPGNFYTTAYFTQTNDCNTGLTSGNSCTFQVTYTPQLAEQDTGQLSIADNAAGSPQTVSLSGQGAYTYTAPGYYRVLVVATSGAITVNTELSLQVVQ